MNLIHHHQVMMLYSDWMFIMMDYVVNIITQFDELQEKLIEKEKVLQAGQTKEKEDLISALLNMGFKRKEVDKIVDATIREFKQDAGFEILLRESLKQLSKI